MGSKVAKISEKVDFGKFWAVLGTFDFQRKLQFLGLSSPSRGLVRIRIGSVGPICTRGNSGSDYDQTTGSKVAKISEKIDVGQFWALLISSENDNFWAYRAPLGA